MERFWPSSSITLSRLNLLVGVCWPAAVSSSDGIMDARFVDSTKYDRFSASQSAASSCNWKGSRFDRKVPETRLLSQMIQKKRIHLHSSYMKKVRPASNGSKKRLTGSCGMMLSPLRRSVSPTCETSTSSTRIEPEDNSTSRNKAVEIFQTA